MNEIQKLDKTRQVLILLRQGFSTSDIATQLNMSEKTVKELQLAEMRELSLAMQEQQEYFVGITIRRTEHLLSKVMAFIDGDIPKDKDGTPLVGQRDINDAIKTAIALMKFEGEVLKLKPGSNDDKKGDVNINVAVQNNTFTASSDLYEVALENMQRDYAGVAWADFAEAGDIITPSEDRLLKLEAAVEKILPDVTPSNDSTDE